MPGLKLRRAIDLDLAEPIGRPRNGFERDVRAEGVVTGNRRLQ